MPTPGTTWKKSGGLVQQGASGGRSEHRAGGPWLWSRGVPFQGSHQETPSCPTPAVSSPLPVRLQQILSLPLPRAPKPLPASASREPGLGALCCRDLLGVTHTWSHTAVRL